VAADLSAAGFLVHAVTEIQHVKAAKLLTSVTFALSALYQPGELRDRAALGDEHDTAEDLAGFHLLVRNDGLL
jgi:hypothetical protein